VVCAVFSGNNKAEILDRKIYDEGILSNINFDKSSDIMVENYRNKLVVYSPGGLVKWLRPEEFGKISKTRNQIIASLLNRTIYVEKMGTGIERIRNAMQSAGLPEPEFTHYESSFYITLVDIEYDTKDGNGGTPQDTPQGIPSDRFQKIVNYCLEPRTRKEIQEHIGIRDREYFRKNILLPLVENKILILSIPDKPNSPNQRYMVNKNE
jgi:ATP-dependent DNA helicase RecG